MLFMLTDKNHVASIGSGEDCQQKIEKIDMKRRERKKPETYQYNNRNEGIMKRFTNDILNV